METTLLSEEYQRTVLAAHAWLRMIDWKAKEAAFRDTITLLQSRLSKLQCLGRYESRATEAEKSHIRHGGESLKSPVPPCNLFRKNNSITSIRKRESPALGAPLHDSATTTALDCEITSLVSRTSARTLSMEPSHENQERRMLVPLCARPARCVSSERRTVAGIAKRIHLRDEQSNTLRDYPLYEDISIGLEELGYEMDKEMSVVPKNCRDDDDVETTSDVLALGVESVEHYLTTISEIADTCFERRKSGRLAKLKRRLGCTS